MYSPLDLLSLETWILLATVVLLIRYYVNKRYSVLKELGIPHSKPSLLKLGNILEMKGGLQEFFWYDLELKNKFGKVFGSYAVFSPRITISDPEILKQIYIKEFSHFPDRQAIFTGVLGKLMNNQLTVISGLQWKRVRNTLSPTFSTSKLKEMFGHVKNSADNMISRLGKFCVHNDGVFDLKDLFGKMSMDSICSAAFGVNANSQDETDEDDKKVVTMAQKLFDVQFATLPLVFLILIFPPADRILKYFDYSVFPKESLNYFVSLTKEIQKKSKNQFLRKDMMTSILTNEISEDEAKLEDAKGMTQNEITANSILMILAGYETTSSAMFFLAYNLAFCIEAQEKLREEIDRAVEEYGDLTYEAFNSMKYVTMCINESLRLYPPAPRNSRYCQKEISINGVTIPKGVHVDVPVYGMGRDPEYWDDPLEFKPERMEDMTTIDPLIFQPFGAGPRNCIGIRFALIEVKLAICKVLQKYVILPCEDTPCPPLDIVVRTSMQPKILGIKLKVTPRT